MSEQDCIRAQLLTFWWILWPEQVFRPHSNPSYTYSESSNYPEIWPDSFFFSFLSFFFKHHTWLKLVFLNTLWTIIEFSNHFYHANSSNLAKSNIRGTRFHDFWYFKNWTSFYSNEAKGVKKDSIENCNLSISQNIGKRNIIDLFLRRLKIVSNISFHHWCFKSKWELQLPLCIFAS